MGPNNPIFVTSMAKPTTWPVIAGLNQPPAMECAFHFLTLCENFLFHYYSFVHLIQARMQKARRNRAASEHSLRHRWSFNSPTSAFRAKSLGIDAAPFTAGRRDGRRITVATVATTVLPKSLSPHLKISSWRLEFEDLDLQSEHDDSIKICRPFQRKFEVYNISYLGTAR